MIGDKLIDIQAGKNYQVHTALVGTGYGAKVHEEETAKAGKLPYELYADRLDILAQKILTMDQN
jgi:D-glycero-D-manno-heptose 1,7-bisphosphate phosphatase